MSPVSLTRQVGDVGDSLQHTQQTLPVQLKGLSLPDPKLSLSLLASRQQSGLSAIPSVAEYLDPRWVQGLHQSAPPWDFQTFTWVSPDTGDLLGVWVPIWTVATTPLTPNRSGSAYRCKGTWRQKPWPLC